MAKLGIQEIVDAVADLSVLELSELVKAIEEKFGVTAAAPMMAAAPAAAAAEAVEEKTEFDVELTTAGENKINSIKALREIDQSLGLAEAKAKVESAPVVVLAGAKKEDAEAAKKKLEDAGAKVTLK
jgi:large subunit ribosomal protein L7/L12